MDFPVNFPELPIPSFSSVPSTFCPSPTSGGIHDPAPSSAGATYVQEEGRFSGNEPPANISNLSLRTSDGSTLNQLLAKRARVENPSSPGSSFNTSSVTETNWPNFRESNAVVKFPRVWCTECVISHMTTPDLDDIRMLTWIKDANNSTIVTGEIVTGEANMKLEQLNEQACDDCAKYTFTFHGEGFELYRVQFVNDVLTYRYLRKMIRPDFFSVLPAIYGNDVEKALVGALPLKKKTEASCLHDANKGLWRRGGESFDEDCPTRGAATFVSRARRSQVGKMTEKKTRESNYIGLVLVSMVSCLVFVSTYWALGKKEGNAATRGSHSRSSKKNNPPKHE